MGLRVDILDFFVSEFYGCINKTDKQRIRGENGRGVFGVVLCAHKPALAGNFNNLDQVGVGVLADALHPCLFKTGAVVVVELEAVAMALADEFPAICFCRF